MIESVAVVPGGKRENPNYIQISGFVPKPLGIRFKTLCTLNELSFSEGVEEALKMWIEAREREEGQTRSESA